MAAPRALFAPLPSGEDQLTVDFDYIREEYVLVFTRTHIAGQDQVVFEGVQLTAGVDFSWLNSGTIQLTEDADGLTDYLVLRQTPSDPLVVQQPGNLSSAKVNLAVRQALDLSEEANALAQDSATKTDELTGRALLVPPGELGGTLGNAAARAGKFLAFDAEGDPIEADGTGTDNSLRSNLASNIGGTLVKTSRNQTVENELTWARAAGPASINEFYDATNGAAAERMALEAALASGREVSYRGLLTLDQAIVMPEGSILRGEGSSSFDTSQGRTCLRRGFGGATTMLIMSNDCQLINLDMEGDLLGTGDLVALKGARCVVDNLSVRRAGGDNFRIGGDMETLNANGWRIMGLRSYAALGRGFYIHHTNSVTNLTFPQGTPDVNAGQMFGGDFLRNVGDNFVIHNAIDNKFFGPTSQESDGRNFHFMDDARGNHIYGGYNEGGALPSRMTALAKGNSVFMQQSLSGAVWENLGTGNVLVPYHRSIEVTGFTDEVSVVAGFGSGKRAAVNLIGDDWGLHAQLFGTPSGVGSGGKGVAAAKRPGNTPIDIFEWQSSVGVNLLNGAYCVGGTQVLGAQEAAIPNAGAGTEVATINAILAAMRNHGMIA